MAEPDWNPDTGGRSLAEILREAGIERANRADRRRSWDDPERDRRSGSGVPRPPPSAPTRAGYGRRKSDFAESLERAAATDAPPMDRRQSRRATPPEPPRRAVPSRPSRRPPPSPACGPTGSPASRTPRPSPAPRRRRRRRARCRRAGLSAAGHARRRADRAQPAARDPRSGTARRERPGREPAGRERHAPHRQPSRTAGEPPVDRADPRRAARGPRPDTRRCSTRRRRRAPSPGCASPASSSSRWPRASASTSRPPLLWEMLPYVAVLLAPLAVAGPGRRRRACGGTGRAGNPSGPGCSALLVLAGTLLTIAPAAELLAAAAPSGRRSLVVLVRLVRARRTAPRSPRRTRRGRRACGW